MINPNPENVKDSRAIISHKWENWLNDKKLFIITQPIEKQAGKK